jgi:hypothetical protein
LTNSSHGAFVISGVRGSGQTWLLKHLISRLSAGERLIIPMHPERTTQSITTQVFWEQLAQVIGMPGDSPRQTLALKLSSIWQLKHIFFVFTDVTDYLREINEFWQELLQPIRQGLLAKKSLILFLVNEVEPLPNEMGIPTVTSYDDQWLPQQIVRLPELAERFIDSDIFRWLAEHKDNPLLSAIRPQIDADILALIQELVDESELRPMDTFRAFYDRCVQDMPKRSWAQVRKEWTTL